jgi:ribonuclease BN (tRNA processing enzyme)
VPTQTASASATTAHWTLTFLGVGGAAAPDLGSASVVLERDGAPLLMVDCGQEALTAYLARYGAPPPALYLTHVHMDHVAGLERLFVANYFNDQPAPTRIFAPAPIIPLLQGRVADYPNVIAEGGANFWDAFRLVPVSHGYWYAGLWFDAFPVRHHVPGTAYGLCLPGAFLYTGDTRPIPEIIGAYADGKMPLVHDCDLRGNPSHTGLPDLVREYPAEIRRQMVVYHYGSAADGAALAEAGLRVAAPGDVLALPGPGPAAAAHAASVRRRQGG